MTFRQTEIDRVVRGFRERSLPKAEWTHEAHLLVAFHYVSLYGREKALCLMRPGIILYNHAVGGVSDENGGYHETLTCFWISIIDKYLKENGNDSAPHIDQVNHFLSSPQAARDWPLQFYSKAYLMSLEARSMWVAPDIKGLM
ncbi:MAG: hypothetical protein IPN29_06480 [Saprospiraceae bacterium]|nr:hypothetical protein [Saprospiraceae bacterium]